MSNPTPGQRWISESEPELGLGTLLNYGFGRAEIFFPATQEVREYATSNAPLRRVAFQKDDLLQLQTGEKHPVDSVREEEGLLIYTCGEKEVPEADLLDTMSFSDPTERLLAGRVDDYRLFHLRTQALRQRARIAASPVRGLAGARIDLIPHQIAIADEVSSRLQPRVLLADEVGLGKTIEACLILQRLRLTHRADRTLILLPEPLVHQWFVELLRRFNLLFAIFDEERCTAIEAGDAEANPFLDSQLILCATDFLASNPQRAEQAREAGFDLLIVDEAHHLEWSPEKPGDSYQLVESLAEQTQAVLLITATPQQLGPEGHFARLRLLDPARYSDLDAFLAESEGYEQLAASLDKLLAGKKPTKKEITFFKKRSAQIAQLAEKVYDGDEEKRQKLIDSLLDTFGTGRVLFRNTRQALSGFPERSAKLHPITPAAGTDPLAAKLDWLADKLSTLKNEKVLLICKTKELVETISDEIQNRVAVDIAQFHEDFTLLQRDRNAAFFAQQGGAQILICSEIGSEGRNFQFAHHLVLFDLPRDPDLVEQRIGRLDRIGQTSTIQLHLPYLVGTEEEVLVRWFHEGLDAIEKNLHGANEIATTLAPALDKTLAKPTEKSIAALVDESRKLKDEVGERLAKGYDRLLELNSAKPGRAHELIEAIETCDEDTQFEHFFLKLLDFCNLQVEDLDDRSYLVTGNEQIAKNLPDIPAEGLALTFDRSAALSREDFHFAGIDHPMLRGGLDILLSADTGNAAFAVWETPGEKTIFLEAYAVIEAVAPAELQIDRFLPPTPVRLVIDHKLANHSQDKDLATAQFRGGNLHKLLGTAGIKDQLLPKMAKRLRALFDKVTEKVVDRAIASAQSQLSREIDRLISLAERNDHITPEEIDTLKKRRKEIHSALSKARPRIDAMRLIFKRPQTASR